MKRLSIILLFAVVSVSSFAINEEKENAKESGSASFQPKPLDDDWFKWLVGQWEGAVESDVGIGKVRMKIELGLNGQFLIMKSEAEITEITNEQRQYLRETLNASDEYIEKSQNSTFEELQIHTIDPKTGEVVGYLFDGLRCIAEGRARRQGNKEIVEWTWSATAKGATSVRIIEKINDNKFTLNHKYTLPNGNKMEDNVEMTRRKEILKDSGLPSFQQKPLDDEWNKWLVGEWQPVSGESDWLTDESGSRVKIDVNEEGRGDIKVEFGLNGQFLIMRGSSGELTDEQKTLFKETLKKKRNVSDENIERFLSIPYKSLEIYTIDPKTGEVIGYLFDSQRCIAEGRGRRQGNKEIIEWRWSGTGQGATSVSIIEKISDNKFTLNHKYILPDGKKMEDKAEFTRKKIKTEK